LPALPDVWENGSIRGICARGGFELSFDWKNKRITKTNITARAAGKIILINEEKQKVIEMQKGQRMEINWQKK
jgi:alpha-L-fucosidase 2